MAQWPNVMNAHFLATTEHFKDECQQCYWWTITSKFVTTTVTYLKMTGVFHNNSLTSSC